MIESCYDMCAPGHIVFGWRRRAELPEHLLPLGTRAHIICGSRTLYQNGEISRFVDLLTPHGIQVSDIDFQDSEPTVSDVDRLTLKFQKKQLTSARGDILVAIGGGSAIDFAKALSATVPNLTQGMSASDFFEGARREVRLTEPFLPVVALPTTAGAGAETACHAELLTSEGDGMLCKKRMCDARLFPKVALVDPEWSIFNPPELTAACGMSVLARLMETFLSKKARPIPQALALQGTRLAFHALETAYRDPGNREAREKMAHAATLSGLCTSNAGLGMIHAVASVLGVQSRIPYRTASAVLLPRALRVNADAAWRRMVVLAANLFPNTFFTNDNDAVETLLYEFSALANVLHIPRRLREIGVQKEQLPTIAVKSCEACMNANPKKLAIPELLSILTELY